MMPVKCSSQAIYDNLGGPVPSDSPRVVTANAKTETIFNSMSSLSDLADGADGHGRRGDNREGVGAADRPDV